METKKHEETKITFMGYTINILIKEKTCRPADFQSIIDTIKVRLDAGFRALTQHVERDGYKLYELDDKTAEISFEPNGNIKMRIRDAEPDDKMPYSQRIVFPCLQALQSKSNTPQEEDKDND